jgi:hypothetical protein
MIGLQTMEPSMETLKKIEYVSEFAFKSIPLRLVNKHLLVLMCLDSKPFTKRMVKQRERDEGNDATNGKFDPFAQTHKRLHVRKRAQNEPSRPENVRVSHLDKLFFVQISVI